MAAAAAAPDDVPPPALPDRIPDCDWQFAQSFGTEESEDQGFCEDDIFTALDFSNDGHYIALGDKAGRITVFDLVEEEVEEKLPDGQIVRRTRQQLEPIEYKFYTEFQSHDKGFDRLHSVEISESINMIRWWPHTTKGVFLLSTNDTAVKLWKIAPKLVRKKKKDKKYPPSSLRVPHVSRHPKTAITATCRREYKNAHGTCHIDSVSVNSDGATFISTDALKINLWDVEVTQECYNIVDIKPDNLADLSEVITSATFHTSHCNLLTYSTSLGSIKFCDLREQALLSNHAKVFQAHKGDDFFSEVVESISDARFTPCGRFIVARDYLTTKVWDVKMERQPYAEFNVHAYLEEYLPELHENECIFDKFEIASSTDGQRLVTGSYDSNFVVHDLETMTSETIHATSEPLAKKHQRLFNVTRDSPHMKALVPKMDFAKKSLHVAWHPMLSTVAISSLNKVYIYQAGV